MEKYNSARRKLRILLALLFISELPVAMYLLFFPYHFQSVFNLPSGPEPFFVREVGNFLIFAAYFQYIAFRNPEKNLQAVQLTIVLRLLAGMLELWEITMLLSTHDMFYFALLFFCVTNFLFAGLIGRYLKQMNLKWIDF